MWFGLSNYCFQQTKPLVTPRAGHGARQAALQLKPPLCCIMNERDRVRGVGLLCCHCVRNIAYYTAGRRDGAFVSDEDFWRNANSNFLDIAVLEWCKLFADERGKHHWRKVVPDADAFLSSLYRTIGTTEATVEAYALKMRTYRDKFLAHLDAERMMEIPELNLAVDTSVFLFNTVRNAHEDKLADAPFDLRTFYKERLSHARDKYDAAT